MAKGNDLADRATKAGADQKGEGESDKGSKSKQSTQQIAAFSCSELIRLQDLQKAFLTTNEHLNKMMTAECTFSKRDLWMKEGKVGMPAPLVPILL